MMPVGPHPDLWWQTLAVLACGLAAVTLAAGIAARATSSAVWRQLITRAAVVSLLVFAVAEMSGMTRLAALLLPSPAFATTGQNGSATEDQRGAIEADSHAGNGSDVPLEASSCSETKGTDVPPSLDDYLVPPQPLASTDSPAAPADSPLPTILAWWPAAVWVAGFLAVLAWYCCGALALLRLRGRFVAVDDEEILETAALLGRRLGLRGHVRLFACARLSSPAAFGVLRPAVVLPANFAQQFDRARQQAVLAHELAHLAARDPLWQCIARGLCAALWWHPAVWWLARQLRAANEAAADEASLLVPDGPSLLADSLVQLARQLVRRKRLGWLTLDGDGFRSRLASRVDRLLRLPGRPWRRASRGGRLTAFVVLPVVCALVVAAPTAWVRGQTLTSPVGGAKMNVLNVAWRGSLAAALWTVVAAAPATADDQAEPKLVPSNAVELAFAGEADRPEGERKDPVKREVERKDGDRPRGDAEQPRREGDRPRAEGERRDAPRERPALQQRRELEEAAAQISRRLAELGERADGDEARALREKLERIRRELRGGERPRAEGERRDPPRERPALQQRRELEEAAAKLRRQLGELKERGAGESDDFKELRAKYERILQQLKETAPREGDRPAARGEGARQPRPDAPPREGEARGGEREVQQLREEVQQLRREMQELRDLLRRMNAREGGDRPNR